MPSSKQSAITNSSGDKGVTHKRKQKQMTQQKTETIPEFVEEYCVEIESVKLFERSDSSGDQWSQGATHWQVKLTCQDITRFSGTHDSLICEFSQGDTYTNAPDVTDVLTSLQFDLPANGYTFQQWCDEFNFDEDSLSAQKIYNSSQTNSDKLHNWLGSKVPEFSELEEC